MNALRPPTFTPGQLERLSRALGATEGGLTGSEIGRLLQQARLENTEPGATKWTRLFNAFGQGQTREKNGRGVLSFIKHALDPSRFLDAKGAFDRLRVEVNGVLAFHGLQYNEDGRFHIVPAATTLSEAEDRAHRLRSALSARGVHQDVLTACRAELLQNNSFHAVLEATKSVAEKLRIRCSLQSDGGRLADEALGGDAPRLRINRFQSDSEKSEQAGFCNLVKGLFGVFRNTTAHALKITWPIKDEDALDLFSLASYIHRRIDAAH